MRGQGRGSGAGHGHHEKPAPSVHASHGRGVPMMLEMQDIKKYFVSGLVKAVDGVSLCVERGECLAIVGESGCGKTTLAKVLLGLLPADEGRILLDGKLLDARGRRKVQIVFQDPYASLDPLWTVRGILSEAFHAPPGLGPQEQERQMRAVLAEVDRKSTRLTSSHSSISDA